MSMFQELDYDSDVKEISSIQFSIMSPDEIRRRSVAEIHTNETFDGDVPKIGGIFDPRMGVLEHGRTCPTDELNNRHCPGYFGHLELAMPVFYIHFIKWIIKTLQMICPKCSKLYIDSTHKSMEKIMNIKSNEKRFTAVHKLCFANKKRRCGDKCEDGCGAVFPTAIKKEPTSIAKLAAIWKQRTGDNIEDLVLLWNALDVKKIFSRISDKDLLTMGFDLDYCRPEWLICSVLPIAPPYVRPSVRAANNTRMEDDLTHKYCDIIKTNKTLKLKLSKTNASEVSSKKAIEEWYQLLQYHVATLINNQLPGIPPAQQRSGRPLKAIYDRLKSKEGRVRGNLMGKRVDFSARSVITPDPRINIDQLGVPIEICKNLTFPERVNKFNFVKLSKCVKNGYYKHPGAKSIKRKRDSKLISLSVIDSSKIILEYGDIVNRHLCYDDIVLFNRQPSLHKMSMMQHRVVPLPYKTFRLNVSVTTPYNADFDGDEMNMHVPQSEATRIELMELASVPSQIISPANNKPIISLVQDTCVGSYLFTRGQTYLTKDEVYGVLSDLETWDGVLPKPIITKGMTETKIDKKFNNFPKHLYLVGGKIKDDLWSGQSLITLIMPDLNFEKKNKNYNNKPVKNNKVVIKNGVVREGSIFDKNILGASSQGLIHTIFNDYGKLRTRKFLNDMENIITNFMLKSGFSVGIGDLIPDAASQEKMKEIVKLKKQKVIELIEHTHKGILEVRGGKNVSDEFESQILGILNQVTNETGSVALKSLDSGNRMLNMISSGSKGSEINLGQMIACVGQQAVDGKRIPLGFTDRSLPHFSKYDDGAAARGFVENSFMNGLSPTEFFFHAMGGREGLIDTAVKTSETGYIQRKLIKGLEDARVVADLTVRDANGNIIQFLYGDDGFNAEKIEKQTIITIGKSNSEIISTFNLSLYDLEHSLTPEIYASLLKDKDTTELKFKEYINKIIEDRDYYFNNFESVRKENSVYYPINIRRLLESTLGNFKKLPKSDLSPIYIIDTINSLDALNMVNSSLGNSIGLLKVLCRIYLSPKKLCVKHKMSKMVFDLMIQEIKTIFYDAVIVNGELVGTIAAQSIGEPSTQMTLNTFHFAGVASKSSVNQGVPRFKELLSITSNLKGPMHTIVLKEPYCYNKEFTQKILNELPITHIKELVISSEIIFDKISATQHKSEITGLEDSMMHIYDIFNFEDETPYRSPWVLKFEFNKRLMIEKVIKMRDIFVQITNKFNKDANDISCFYTNDNASKLIMRIQINIKKTDIKCDQDDMICVLKTLEKTILNDIVLMGIQNITGATMECDKNYIVYDKEADEFKKKKIWHIYTNGTNMKDLLSHPYINQLETLSNNIHEINDMLGIEAARNILFKEINEVFETAGSYINSRHIGLLVDVITNKGILMSIDRHGINKSDRGPLAKCSFEETPDILARAAIFSQVDNMTSVSSNIMLGQEVPVGTGCVDIIFDEEKYIDLMNEHQVEYSDSDAGSDSDDYIEKEEFLQQYCKNLF